MRLATKPRPTERTSIPLRALTSFAVLGASLAACEARGPGDDALADPGYSLYALVETIDGTSFGPPLGPTIAPAGPFDASLLGRLEVVLEAEDGAGRASTLGTFSAATTPGLKLLAPHELYWMNVPAAAYFTDPSLSYRFRARLDGREIGRSDMSSRIFEVMSHVPGVPVGVKLRIEARAVPTLASLSPAALVAGSPDFLLTVTGTGFAKDSIVRLGTADLTTTWISATELSARVPATAIARAGRLEVAVFTPTPGGGTSGTAALIAVDPTPVLTSLSPASATIGSGDLTLTLTGAAFSSGAHATFGGAALTTTFVSASELTAIVPGAALASGGAVAVTVVNPAPAGTSAALTFTVTVPVTRSCMAAHTMYPGAASGTYTIDPDGPGPLATFEVYCDMATDGGGWTLVSKYTGAPDGTAYSGPDSFRLSVLATDASPTANAKLEDAVIYALVDGDPNAVFRVRSASYDTVIQRTDGANPFDPWRSTTTARCKQATAAAWTSYAMSAGGCSPSILESINVRVSTYTQGCAYVGDQPGPKPCGDGQAFSSNQDARHVVAQWIDAGLTDQGHGAGAWFVREHLTSCSRNTDCASGVCGLGFCLASETPTLSALAPATIAAGSAATAVTLTGSGFLPGATASLDGVSLATAFRGSTELVATIPASALTAALRHDLTVSNPAPVPGTTAARALTVANPAPVLGALTPASAVTGGAQLTLTIDGSGFFAGASVTFDGGAVATTLVSATRVTAIVPAASIATAGSHAVVVTNAAPNLGPSAALTFVVNNATPALTAVSPATAAAGSGATTVTLTGTSFLAGATAALGGTSLATTFVSSTQLTATLPASALAAAAVLSLTVTNPAPTAGASNTAAFTVQNPAPVLSSLTPSAVTAGAAATALTVTGSAFMSGAVVRFNGTNLSTTFVSSTQLTATIPASALGTAGSFDVVVSNPSPAAGASAARSFSVVAPPSTARSCMAALLMSPSATSGTYTIDPDGSGPIAAFNVYCDMSTDGGGWTLVSKYSGTPDTNTYSGAAGFRQTALTDATPSTNAKLDTATIYALVNGDTNAVFRARSASYDTVIQRTDGINPFDYFRSTTTAQCKQVTASTWTTYAMSAGGCAPNIWESINDRLVTWTQGCSYVGYGSSTKPCGDGQGFSGDSDASHAVAQWIDAGFTSVGRTPGVWFVREHLTSCSQDTDCATGVCSQGFCRQLSSCSDILAANPAAPNGAYTMSINGRTRSLYCDMTGGGWTMVARQVAGQRLPDSSADVSPSSFGSLTASWRVGAPTLAAVAPAVAWKLTDATNSVYFRPTCRVDWARDYSGGAASDCTTGYTTTSFTSPWNGGFMNVFTRGIGINNSGYSCSMRMYQASTVTAVGLTWYTGAAYPCNPLSAETVSLWFR